MRIDLSGNDRIPLLLDLVREISRTADPGEVLSRFVDAMRKAYGARGYLSLATAGLPPGNFKATRFLTPEGVDRITSDDRWIGDAGMPVRSGGFIGGLISTPEPKLHHHLAVADDPVFGDGLAPYRSLMALPVYDGGQVTNWAILLHPDPALFTPADIEWGILRTNLIGAALYNKQLARQLREASAWIQGQVDQIAEIQRALLPPEIPRIPGLSVAADYATFDRAGGDYYDIAPLPPDPERPGDAAWGFLISDASGHGPASAVVVAMMHAILYAYPSRPRGPAEILEHLNRRLFARRIGNTFVTAFCAMYRPADRSLTYACAGHNPPLLRRADGVLARLDGGAGPPLGILDAVGAGEETVTLSPGDVALLYTDGITEAESPKGTMLGEEGLSAALAAAAARAGGAGDILREVLRRLRGHEAGTRPGDDQTVVVLRGERD